MSSFHKFIKENLLLASIELADESKASVLNLSNFDMKEIPPMVFQLKNLKKLYLDNNCLQNLLEEISKLKYLKVLTLDYNRLNFLTPEIGKLSNLVCLNLSHNHLRHLTPEIGRLKRLEVLWLNHTHLEALPSEIGDCTYLDTLGARGNFIKELPPEIGKLHRLRWLTLEGNLLKVVPTEICGLRNLIHLNLSNNQFEKIPKISELQSLRFVFLSQNFIKEIDEELLTQMAFVKIIALTDNPIENMSNYPQIKNLKLNSAFDWRTENENSDDSDSKEWEESAPSSDLDLTDSSFEEMSLNEILEAALPQVAKFTSMSL